MSDGGSAGGSRYARFIPSEEISRVAEWRFGAVDLHVRAAAEQAARIEAAQAADRSPAMLQKMQQVYDAAFAAGLEQGRADATREAHQRMDDYVAGAGQEAGERLGRLLEAAETGLDDLQSQMADSVLEIACGVARQVLRRELAVDSGAVLPVVREALGLLRADGRAATVRLDPHDLALLQPGLADEAAGMSVSWLPDASVGAGGCRVEAAGSVIDGRLPTRWKRAVAALGRDDAWEDAAEVEAEGTPSRSGADR